MLTFLFSSTGISHVILMFSGPLFWFSDLPHDSYCKTIDASMAEAYRRPLRKIEGLERA